MSRGGIRGSRRERTGQIGGVRAWTVELKVRWGGKKRTTEFCKSGGNGCASAHSKKCPVSNPRKGRK